jgi:hypothetical protein
VRSGHPRSLLDGADLPAVRAAAARGRGAFATAIACLRAGGVLQHDPDDPGWLDRDRVIDGAHALGPSDARSWWTSAPVRDALSLALGAGLSSSLDGGIFRVWCLLDGAADDGRTWDAARAAAAQACAALTVVAAGDPEARLVDLLRAAGWRTFAAAPDDPLEVLGAMDRAVAHGAGPAAVVLVR